ncbi:hypothetical protein D3C85_1580040 [compost metagenome]
MLSIGSATAPHAAGVVSLREFVAPALRTGNVVLKNAPPKTHVRAFRYADIADISGVIDESVHTMLIRKIGKRNRCLLLQCLQDGFGCEH